jgi:hypothetical protein
VRALAPDPALSFQTRLVNGYQLCARCGAVLIEGDRVTVAFRAQFYPVFTHPDKKQCLPAKAAPHGWEAIRRAEDRQGDNVLTPRMASACDTGKQCVCLLDNEHIEAEAATVKVSASDEAPLYVRHNPGHEVNVEQTFEQLMLNSVSDGKQAGKLDLKRAITRTNSYPVIHNRVEDAMIAALGTGAAEVLRDIRRKERRVYAAGHHFSDEGRIYSGVFDPFYGMFSPDRGVSLSSAKRYKKRGKSRPQGASHTFDLSNGTPVELAVYSKMKVCKIENKQVDEFQLLQLSKRSKPLRLPWNSRTNPGLYVPVIRKVDRGELESYVDSWLSAGGYSRPVALNPAVLRLATAWQQGLRVMNASEERNRAVRTDNRKPKGYIPYLEIRDYDYQIIPSYQFHQFQAPL